MRGASVLAAAVGVGVGVAAWALWVRPRAPASAPIAPAPRDPDARPLARPPELDQAPAPVVPAPAPGPVELPAPATDVTPPPAARFTTYRTVVQGGDGGTALEITVDLAAKARAPDAAFPRLLQLTIDFVDPDPTGLDDRGADSQLDAIGTAIRDELAPSVKAWYVGKVRREGSETHYVYCPEGRDLEAGAEALERRFDRHTWLVFAQDDAAWTSYLDLLYPSSSEHRPTQGEDGRR